MTNKATHNSGSGEESFDWRSRLLVPFARCQAKTLSQQHWAGVRLFDLRVKNYKGKLRLAHGWWVSKVTLARALKTLHDLASTSDQPTYVMVTYQGEKEPEWAKDIKRLFNVYPSLILTEVACKTSDSWRLLYASEDAQRYTRDFTIIEGWRRILPVPKVWDWMRGADKDGGAGMFVMYDFV